MVKIAVFVEGQTELIFMREYLLKMFEHQNVEVKCFNLLRKGELNATEYSFSSPDAAYFFDIINVGNDNAVLKRLLEREKYLWNSGFQKIFALRDMYSKDYREEVQSAIIDENVNRSFVENTQNTINALAVKPQNIHFFYAIMEVEAWILALKNCFIHLHSDLNTQFILEKSGHDLENSDPEISFFHPASIVEKIYELVGFSYNKSKGHINAILSNIQKQDFINLAEGTKCQSFKNMHKIFFPN